jgi:hypothetical protein
VYSKHLLRNEPFRVTKLSSGDTNEVHFDIKTRRQLAGSSLAVDGQS